MVLRRGSYVDPFAIGSYEVSQPLACMVREVVVNWMANVWGTVRPGRLTSLFVGQ